MAFIITKIIYLQGLAQDRDRRATLSHLDRRTLLSALGSSSTVTSPSDVPAPAYEEASAMTSSAVLGDEASALATPAWAHGGGTTPTTPTTTPSSGIGGVFADSVSAPAGRGADGLPGYTPMLPGTGTPLLLGTDLPQRLSELKHAPLWITLLCPFNTFYCFVFVCLR